MTRWRSRGRLRTDRREQEAVAQSAGPAHR